MAASTSKQGSTKPPPLNLTAAIELDSAEVAIPLNRCQPTVWRRLANVRRIIEVPVMGFWSVRRFPFQGGRGGAEGDRPCGSRLPIIRDDPHFSSRDLPATVP
jgi:hypothetical protein